MNINLIDNIDFLELQKDLILSLRGRLSQSSFAKKLGINASQIGRWESGESEISYSNFAKILQLKKIDFIKVFRRFNMSSVESIDQLIQYCGQRLSQEQIERLGISKQTLRRWASGKSDPRIIDIFKLIHCSENYLLSILDNILPSQRPTRISKLINLEKVARELQFQKPFSAVVILALDHKRYLSLNAHSDKVLEEITHIKKEELRNLLEKLESIGVVAFQDEKYRVLMRSGYSFSHGNKLQSYQLKSFWLSELLRRYNKDIEQYQQDPKHTNNVKLAYGVISYNQKVKSLILEKQNNCFREILQIIGSSENNGPMDTVGVIAMGMADLTEQGE